MKNYRTMMKGQTLIEVLIALGVIVVVVTAISTAVLTSLNNTQYSKLQNQAAQYAQQGIEVMKSYRDAESLVDAFGAANVASTSFRCLPDNCNPIVTSDYASCFTSQSSKTNAETNCPKITTQDEFTRYVKVEMDNPVCGDDVARVTSIVQWSDGKCNGSEKCHSVDVKTCMIPSVREGL